MRYRFLTILLIVSAGNIGLLQVAAAQNETNTRPDSIPTTGDIYVARAVVVDGDTLWVAELDEIYIFPTKRFKNRREYRR